MTPQEIARTAAVEIAIELFEQADQRLSPKAVADLIEPTIMASIMKAMFAVVAEPSKGRGR